jgi:hypothetical protein
VYLCNIVVVVLWWPLFGSWCVSHHDLVFEGVLPLVLVRCLDSMVLGV